MTSDLQTVLFVDDEQHVTDALRMALHKAPFEVVTANSVEEGREILRRQPVDVVVSDERMPSGSGADFLAEVRRDHPGTGRVLLTGQASVEATIRAVNEARVFHVLTKPCPQEKLLTCIAEAHQAGVAERRNPDEAGPTGPTGDELGQAFDRALAATRVVYQPLYWPSGERIQAYEALVRSNDPTLSSPVELIDAATRLGRQSDLDRRVVELVRADLPHVPYETLVFLNLLPESLGDPRLLAALNRLSGWASRIGLEITERSPIPDSGPAVAALERLRAAGFRLVLDDLGAGYSGLNSFASMKPDVVKFDMELVRDIDQSSTRSRLVGSLVAACRELGIITVAEGIETAEEYQHLVELGCDLFQGFALGRPGPPWAEADPPLLTRHPESPVR